MVHLRVPFRISDRDGYIVFAMLVTGFTPIIILLGIIPVRQKGKEVTMEKFIEKRPQAIPCIVAAVFLFLAFLDWPYGYYQLLRLVVTGAAAWVAYIAFTGKKQWLMAIFIIVALLFNPLVPVRLGRETWAGIDVLCAVGFIVMIFVLKGKE